MKKNFRTLLNLLLIAGVLMIFPTSCRKCEDINNPTQSNTVKDIDGNIYHTVTIGTQVWMVENLRTTKLNDGTEIPNVSDKTAWDELATLGYCWYNNETSNKIFYGGLYNWYAINSGKLCPKGWHIASDDEWKQLEKALGMTQAQADLDDWRGTDQGTQMKTTSVWYNSGNGTNTSGFSALPGGYRDSFGVFYYIGINGFWWTSTENSSSHAWYRYLGGGFAKVTRSTYFKNGGFNVRCIKD